MAIYTRDNINYGGMLGNAMQARANQIQRDYDNYMKQPLAWANAVNQTGQTINDAFKLAAQYSHDDSKLAAQQQFQAEQNAKSLAEQLNRAREQQAWQARQNELQRASTERIAELNRNKYIEQRAQESLLKDENDYKFNRGMVNMLNDEIDSTEDESKKDKLRMELLKYQNNVDLYERMHNIRPVSNNDSSEFSSRFLYEANNPQSAEPVSQPKITEQLAATRAIGQNYQKNSLAANEKILADYDAILTEDNKKIIEKTLGKPELDKIIAERTNIVTRIQSVKDFNANKQQYITDLKSGKVKFTKDNKYGVKEDLVKDPATNNWIKIYR